MVSRKAVAKWNSAHMATIRGTVPVEQANAFRNLACDLGMNPNAVFMKFVNIAVQDGDFERDKVDLEIMYMTKPVVVTTFETATSLRKQVTCSLCKEKADAFKVWCEKRETTVNKVFALIVASVADNENKYNARTELNRLYTMDV